VTTPGVIPTPRWVRPVTVLLWLLIAVALSGVLAALFVRLPRVNEGWNAFHALHAVTRPNMYAFDGYANFPNYPPLAFYPAGWLGLFIGDMVFAGRVLSLLGLAVVTINVAFVARRLDAPGWLAAGVYLAITMSVSHRYIGSSDPQFVGHALQSTALVLLLGKRSWPTVALAALLCVLGGLVKLNLIVLPVAATVWLAIADRRALVPWLVSAFAASAVACGICYLAFGDAVFQQVLGHERFYSLQLVVESFDWLAGYLPLVGTGFWLLLSRRRDPGVVLLGLYLGLALIAGLGFSAGRGVNLNTYFDLGIASAPLGVAALFRMRNVPRRIAVGLVSVAILYLGVGAERVYLGRWNAEEKSRPYNKGIAELSQLPGTAFCNDLAYCYWAGKESIIDRSNTAQKLLGSQAAVEQFESALAVSPPDIIVMEGTSGGPVEPSVEKFLGDYHMVRPEAVRTFVRNVDSQT
jgi:hypothetical protein